MNKKRLARAALIFAVAALVALTAGCLAACDRDDGKVTVNATINMTYGDAIPEWTVTLDGADEGDTAESLGIADAIVIADESLTELPDAGTHTFDIDISGVRQSKYELVAGKATLNVSKRPVKVHVTDQEVPYSSTGAKPYTDGTQANVEGTLVQGHTLSLGITAETDEVLDAGKTSSMAFDGSAKVFAGGTDVTSNYAIEVSADENLVMTVVKGVAKYIAYAAVDYDGNNHTFNGSNATLWVESGQDVTVSNGDVAFKEGGEHAAADIFIKGTSNWEEQRVKGVLGIRSFENEDGRKMTLTEACDAAAEAEDGLTVYMFTDTEIGIDTVIPDGLTVVTRVIGANKNDGEDEDHDLSDIVGVPTYSEKANKGAANKHVDADATKVEHVLTVKDGVTLNIEGALIVSGLLGNMGQGLSGHTSGEHCVLALEGDAVVSEGGALDIRGYVRGEGTLTAKSGSATYMPFVVYDFRGGSNTTVVYMKGDIIPFNTFDPFYNIQASAVFESGATATSYLERLILHALGRREDHGRLDRVSGVFRHYGAQQRDHAWQHRARGSHRQCGRHGRHQRRDQPVRRHPRHVSEVRLESGGRQDRDDGQHASLLQAPARRGTARGGEGDSDHRKQHDRLHHVHGLRPCGHKIPRGARSRSV